jgi:hypothetical protein
MRRTRLKWEPSRKEREKRKRWEKSLFFMKNAACNGEQSKDPKAIKDPRLTGDAIPG